MTLGDNYTNVADTDPSPYSIMLPPTRSQRHIAGGGVSRSQRNAASGEDSSIHTPAAGSVLGESQAGPTSDDQITPVIRERRIRWERQPREPLPPLKDVREWVGKQLDHENLPKKYQSVPPEGELMPLNEDYPEGLFAIPNKKGQPRIIVPPAMVKSLILQTHEDIHHQHHIKQGFTCATSGLLLAKHGQGYT